MTAHQRALNQNSGQALLIIILVLAIALTVGLSVVSRTVTDIRISRQEEESARAFSWAEAGIEEALKLDLGSGQSRSQTVGEVSYTVSAVGQGGGQWFLFSGSKFDQGETQTVWLAEHNDKGVPDPASGMYSDNKIDFYWGNDGEDSNTAIEATIFYKEAGVFKSTKGAFDPVAGRCGATGNGFECAETGQYNVGPEGGQLTFRYRRLNFPIPSSGGITLYALRLKPIYNNTAQIMGVASPGGKNFPSQGKCYISSAQVTTSGVSRRVQQCQFYKTPLTIFDYALFSQGSID
jgi:hypothetical protein